MWPPVQSFSKFYRRPSYLSGWIVISALRFCDNSITLWGSGNGAALERAVTAGDFIITDFPRHCSQAIGMSDSCYTHLRAVVYLSEAEGQSVERISRLRGSLVHDLFGGSWRHLPGRLATRWVRE